MAKILQGKVVSTKMQKTAVVAIMSQRAHPVYQKKIKKTTKLKAHVEGFEVKEGDSVRIQEVRPISRDKRFKVIEVLKI